MLADPVSKSVRATQSVQRVHAILAVSAISAVLENERTGKPATTIEQHDSNEPNAEQLPRSLRPIRRPGRPTEVAEQLPLTELRDARHGHDADVQRQLPSAKPDAQLPAALRSAAVRLPGSELVPDADDAAIRGIAHPVEQAVEPTWIQGTVHAFSEFAAAREQRKFIFETVAGES